jgi:ribosomal protein S6--L-glutamate ligase
MMEQFKSFITEQKDEKYRVLVISAEKGDKAITAKRMEEEATKLGYPIYVAGMDGTYTKFENGVRTVHKSDDDKGFEIHVSDTVIFVRGTPERDSWLDLVSQLEKAGYCVINSRDCMELASDKYRTYLRLQDFGLTQPKTVLIPNEDGIKTAFKNLDTKFPIIMKTLRGSKGVGVLFIESERGLNSLVQLLFKQDKSTDILIQEYIKTDFDVRVLVLGGKIIATMQRDVLEGDFRSNYSQGAKIKTYELSDLEIEQCLLAAKAIGGLFTAVDFIPSENTKKDPPYILEINSSPGTEGIEEANKKNIVKEVIKYFDNPDLRYTVPTECGFLEVLNVEPYGPIISKFDTGNSSLPVIHGDDIELKGKMVHWTCLGKRVKKPLVRVKKVNLGGLRDYSEERYTVHLDIEFAGTIYKNIEFTVDDRKKRTRILLNLGTLRLLNVIVNPQRKYLITTKFTLDK